MADSVDIASEITNHIIEAALQKRKPTMTFTGICQNGDCGETLNKGFFCCPECREDYERIERAQVMRRLA